MLSFAKVGERNGLPLIPLEVRQASSIKRLFSSKPEKSKDASVECPYEKRINAFLKQVKPELNQDYFNFMQEMRLYFVRGSSGYNLYDMTFLKHILRSSTKKYSEY